MDLKDLLLTPIYLVIIYAIAYIIRPRVTNKETKRYFIPALTLKLVGAIALGLIYTFYYHIGDTFSYYNQGKILYNTLLNYPSLVPKLFLTNGIDRPDLRIYIPLVYWYDSPAEFFVIKVIAFLSLFSFSTYTVIALFFALFSFAGLWALYIALLKINSTPYREFAIALFFIPSVFFWGSGVLKDTICLGALGLLFYGFYEGTIEKKNLLRNIILILVSLYILKVVKVYILLSFLPPAIIWIFMENKNKIKSAFIRFAIGPLLLIMGGISAYYGVAKLTEGDVKYDLSNLAGRTKINAEYLYHVSRLQEGSSYYLGSLDGTFSGMIKLAPNAITVSLFRPYFWEVRNPLMLLSALEGAFFLVLTLLIFFKVGFSSCIKLIFNKPILIFCFVFSLIFAFAVGINSFNFGTLVRYKIPLIPFFLSGLFLLKSYSRRNQTNSFK